MSKKKLKQVILNDDKKANYKPVSRRCLRCDVEFLAPTNIIRICRQCKVTDTWQSGDDSYFIPGARYKKS